MNRSDDARVGICMGSDSDWATMEAASTALDEFDVAHRVDVVSAHRMPEEMFEYGKSARSRGLRIIIAGAGGAAHLPGMLASVSPVPVIGVPVNATPLDGMDSLWVARETPGSWRCACSGSPMSPWWTAWRNFKGN